MEVKSRYMDTASKTHRATQPSNDAVRVVKQTDQFSSSGTSTRTPSPSVKRKPAPKNIDSHMSMDSLASPKKQPLNQQRNTLASVHHEENALSRDSLADSFRSSSVRTERTFSQESLARVQQANKGRLSVGAKNLKNDQKSNNGGSTSGSTSSVGPTQKGSRLMRNFSDSGVSFRNSTRGISSNSSNASSARTSFLSKKSREILERRSMMETQTQAAAAAAAVAPITEMRRSLPINKSSSTSNIPTHRRIFNTTLHLRKTANVAIPEKPAKEVAVKAVPANKREGLKPSRIAQKVPVTRKANGVSEVIPPRTEKSERDLLATEKAFEVLGLADTHCDDSLNGEYESKMVRSSTFSKEFPDLSQSIEIS